MEADWEFEVGGDAPVIEAHWTGLVDLRTDPSRAAELIECRQLPALEGALVKLNAARSPLWTSKVDVFLPDRFDPDEPDATGECNGSALACYIDLLSRDVQQWRHPSDVESHCRQFCDRLHAIELCCCRGDLVIRRACRGSNMDEFGVTVYLSACGKDLDGAEARLSECLEVFVDILVPQE